MSTPSTLRGCIKSSRCYIFDYIPTRPLNYNTQRHTHTPTPSKNFHPPQQQQLLGFSEFLHPAKWPSCPPFFMQSPFYQPQMGRAVRRKHHAILHTTHTHTHSDTKDAYPTDKRENKVKINARLITTTGGLSVHAATTKPSDFSRPYLRLRF